MNKAGPAMGRTESRCCRWLGAGALALLPVLAHAFLELQGTDSVRFVTGGVSFEERQEIVMVLPDYNLKVITAAQQSGEYLADATLTLSDASGRTVIASTLDGPWLLARVPPGAYELTCTYDARQQRQRITIPAAGRREAIFHWFIPANPADLRM